MKKILTIFLMFFSCQLVFAVEIPPNNSWSWKQHKLQREKNRLQAHLIKNINEEGSKKTIEAVVETTPTASKVGGVMMKRIKAVAGSPGGAMIGSIAVMELIEAIGWVMEDGSYIKKLPKNPDDVPAKFSCTFDNYSLSLNQALQTCTPSNWTQVKLTPKGQTDLNKHLDSLAPGSIKSAPYEISVVNTNNSSSTPVVTLYALNYKKEMPKTEDEKHILTPTMLGAAMLGSGYVDPDPKFNNDSVNNDRWTGVGDSYTHEPSGVGNELADALDDKAERAKTTSDGKPAPIGDSRYNKPLDSNDDANDRQWDGEEGTQGETESTEKENPETGEKVQQGTFKLPKFCDWAMTVCEWYNRWKTTDDWLKEEPELKDEPLEIEDKEIIAYQREDYIQFGQSCPFSPQIKSLPLGVLGTLEFETDLTFICTFGTDARPFVLGIGHLGALIFLLIGLRNGNA